MMAPRGWNGAEYQAALRELSEAARRERALTETAGRSDVVDRAMVNARAQLQRLGEAGLMRPLAPPKLKGTSDQLQRERQTSEQEIVRTAGAIEQEVGRIAAARAAGTRQAELQQDLLWRVTVPVLAGLAAVGVLGQVMLVVLAAAIGTALSTVLLGLTRAYVYRRLLPAPGRAGLSDQDAALVCGGILGTLFGIIAAAAAAGFGDRAAALLFAAVAGYTAVRRFSAWRASQS